MSIPHVGWPVGADADQPSGGSGTPTGVAGPGGNASSAERAARGYRRGSGGLRDRGTPVAGPAVSVLADRLAAALVHHEPGWRLPRHSALARRYNVSAAEIDAAVEELASRHLVRRLADGQVYRASPAEYLIDLGGVSGLASQVDAMGGEFSCRSRQVAWRLPPEDIGWALGVPADQQVCVVRYLWTMDGEPAALSTTYVPATMAPSADTGKSAVLPNILNLLQLTGSEGGRAAMPPQDALAGTPQDAAAGAPQAAPAGAPRDAPAGPPSVAVATALHIEMQAPPPSVARSLRLTAGQPAMIVTVRFSAPDTGRPAGLTIAVLRPEMFRVVLRTSSSPLRETDASNLSGSWTHAIEGWEP